MTAKKDGQHKSLPGDGIPLDGASPHPEDEEPQQGHGAHKDRQGLVYGPLSPDPKDGVGEKALGK
tara:strand:+ start:716 stop:910 length:195 start_codon:yes stop_codon:yes gene_type:complete